MSAKREICGGNRPMKDVSGDFIRQDCGAAYSVDAMRVLLTGEIVEGGEGVVDASLAMESEPDSPE